ncbi:MAG TPA: hypothetical protein VHZ02_00110 [Acidimicrobiales bacterium]|nr:hypothetical protein [Acidimicrobiales bacterium]
MAASVLFDLFGTIGAPFSRRRRGAAQAGLTPVLVEANSWDTYDPWRDALLEWAGGRLGALSDVLPLVD